MSNTTALALALILLAGCANGGDAFSSAPGVLPGGPDAFVPLEEGAKWIYEVWDDEGRVFTLEKHQKGGDVRSLPDEPGRVRFDFTYGTLAGDKFDTTKSIFARASNGLRLYYFDAHTWALWFDPPLPLLPPEIRVGNEWIWTGKLDIGDDDTESTGRLRIEDVETIRVPAGEFTAVRVRQVHETPAFDVISWYVRDIGLVRRDVTIRGSDGTVARRGVRLVKFTPPTPES